MGHGVLQSVSNFVASCGKQVAKASKKLLVSNANNNGNSKIKSNGRTEDSYHLEELKGYCPYNSHQPTSKLQPRSPLRTPPRSPLHQILSRKSSLVPFLSNKKEKKEENSYYDDEYWHDGSDLDEDGLPDDGHGGDDGVWRKNILMGGKCEPLDFSGVIYYDNDGRRLDRKGKQSKVNVVEDRSQNDHSCQVGEHPSSAAYKDCPQPVKLPPPPLMSPVSTPRTPRPRSPLHQMLSRKASFAPFLGKKDNKKKNAKDRYYDAWEDANDLDATTPGEDVDNDGGVWRKNILMGEKCEPLDFPGVIYYDNEGRRLDHVPPRSPRHPVAGGDSPFRSFTFPAVVDREGEDQYYDAWEDESDADEGLTTPGRDEDDGRVWRKNILMGERCEQPDFSGAILYDNEGRRLDQVPPRSPRHPQAGGGNPFPSFSFPVIIEKTNAGPRATDD